MGQTVDVVRVLHVEDEPDLRSLVEAFLADASLLDGARTEVVGAPDLATGLELLRDASPDLAVLDLGLPDATGTTSLLEVVDAAPTVPVVVLTSDLTPGLELEVLRAGADELVRKSELSLDPFVRSLQRVLARDQNVRSRANRIALSLLRARAEEMAGDADGVEPVPGHMDLPMTDAMPELAAELRTRYGRIALRSLEEQVVETEPRAVGELDALVRDLAKARATASDVARLHVAALEALVDGMPQRRSQAVLVQAAGQLPRTLGLLAMRYRRQLVGEREPAGG